MMKVREAPLPHDLQYVIDGAVELGHLTGGAHVACSLYGKIAEMDQLSVAPRPGLRGWPATAAMIRDFEGYGQAIIARLDGAMQAAARGASATSMLRILADQGDFICGQSYEDEVWGGSMIHRHQTMARRGNVYPRLDRRMRTDEWVKRRVRAHRHEAGFVHVCGLWSLMGEELPPISQDGFALLAATMSDQRERARLRAAEYFRVRDGKKKPVERREQSRRRRCVIRATAAAVAVLGAATVSAFARGEAVVLPADGLAVEIRLATSIDGGGHGALNIGLKDGGGAFLSSLCLFQDLPVLDQLTSLALHVRTGGIADVIAAGNLYGTSGEAFAHPLLSAKRPKPSNGGMIPPLFGRVFKSADDRDRQREMCRAYEAEMSDRFRQRLFLTVLGRKGPAAWATYESLRGREEFRL